MADRKVLNKYFPKNFDHDRLVKIGWNRLSVLRIKWYNDLSFITGRDLNKLRKEPTEG
jgi:hypothetical protein